MSFSGNASARRSTFPSDLCSRGLLDSRTANRIAIIYLAVVVICAVLAFKSGALLDLSWLLIVICVTLPWGALSWVFVWALIHDNTHYFAMAMHITWGILNAFIGLWIARRCRGRQGWGNA